MLNATIAAKCKEVYSQFFDSSFNEATKGPGSFVRPHVGSLYKLGPLTGLVIYLAPYETVVTTIQIKGGRDIVAAYNFFEIDGGTKVVANMINVPSTEAGDRIIDAVDASLADLKQHFGGLQDKTKPGRAAPAKSAAAAKMATAPKTAKPAKAAMSAPAAKPAKAAAASPRKAAAPAKPAPAAKQAAGARTSAVKAAAPGKPARAPAGKATPAAKPATKATKATAHRSAAGLPSASPSGRPAARGKR